jgi:L-amino acid N-acyltransferase YncA
VTLTDDDTVVAPWVGERTGDDFQAGVTACLGVMDEDKMVAGVVYDHLTGPCVTATIAVEGKCLPRRMIRAMFNFPFHYLGVRKILVYINEANEASLKLAKRLGFAVEAAIKDVYVEGDMLVLSLPKQDCVWIRRL